MNHSRVSAAGAGPSRQVRALTSVHKSRIRERPDETAGIGLAVLFTVGMESASAAPAATIRNGSTPMTGTIIGNGVVPPSGTCFINLTVAAPTVITGNVLVQDIMNPTGRVHR
ncbi:MAG TPA: hypothetical protein VI653_30530 [Steroidobacteraceae bacterium]